MILELLPPLNMLFLLTTAAGSALWAVKLEDEARNAQAPEVGAEHQPAHYEDDPV
jgi:hypothetical protein